MSDANLRELERRWQESGAQEDELRFLQERLRCGDVESSQLRLAAGLGHVAAALAAGLEPQEQSSAEAVRRLLDLPELEGEACSRALLAATRRGLPVWDRHYPNEGTPRLTLETCERLLLGGPGAVSKSTVTTLERALARSAGGRPYPVDRVPQACLGLLRDLAAGQSPHSFGLVLACEAAFAKDTPEEFCAAIRAELVPWVLGYGDPVWSRVQEREGKITPQDLET